MPDRSEVQVPAAPSRDADPAVASSFYVVEVRRAADALGYRAAARAVEEFETRRFASFVELCLFLQSTADAGADDSCCIDLAMRGAA